MEKRNPINWFEIATIDLERAKKFYEDVFKAEFQLLEMPGMKMYVFNGDPDQPGTVGSLIMSEENKPSTDGTIIYFTCEDAQNELDRVENAGGKIIVPKTSIGEHGNIALIIDTEGNRIGLHSNN